MTPDQHAIEEFFRDRYGKEAIFVPSGRMAQYLAFKEWLRPGDRLLISPINDDVVFFAVLAAGLVPVIAPLDPRTGNLDPDAVDDATWSRVQAVMTTNLYGMPDRMDRLTAICEQRGLLLIEDACQAIDTQVGGRRIGTFASVAAFSMSKHVKGAGGVLAFSDRARRASLEARARTEVLPMSPRDERSARMRLRVRNLAAATNLLHTLRHLRRRLDPPAAERNGHRMPFDAQEVRQARGAGGGLDAFDRWVRVDNSAYRACVPVSSMRDTLERLRRFETIRRKRLAGAERLLQLGLTPKDLPLPADSALYRVPLFIRHREDARLQFARLGLELDYIYDPPLDVYAAPDMAERLPSPPGALRWSRDVLPVDPIDADRFLKLLKRVPPLVSALA